MTKKTAHEYLLQPDHIAVVDASNDELKPGGRVLKKIKDNGYTGAMAGSDTAVQALFDKAGIIRVKSKMELIDATCALACGNGPIKGNRVASSPMPAAPA